VKCHLRIITPFLCPFEPPSPSFRVKSFPNTTALFSVLPVVFLFLSIYVFEGCSLIQPKAFSFVNLNPLSLIFIHSRCSRYCPPGSSRTLSKNSNCIVSFLPRTYPPPLLLHFVSNPMRLSSLLTYSFKLETDKSPVNLPRLTSDLRFFS